MPPLEATRAAVAPSQSALAPPRYTVAVRTLCEFTAKRGDLDLRFTPSPSAQEGIAGHQLVTGRRPAGYQREVPLQGRHGALQVRGRADGFDPAAGRLEEIKTHKGPLTRQPANHRALHWAQLRVYGALLCAEQGLAALTLALVYLDVGSGRETVFTEHSSAAELQAFWQQQAEAFMAWAQQEADHREARNAALMSLAFPHPSFRHGQRALAEAVYKVSVAGRCLLAEAPTGIGKTMATVFPQLRAMPGQQLDKLFFLTAKTSGRALALGALRSLHQAPARQRLQTQGPAHAQVHMGAHAEACAEAHVDAHAKAHADAQAPAQLLPLRSLELVARDKSCEHPDKACHGASCPLAQGFYDRLPAARQAAVVLAAQGPLEAPVVRQVALAHQVCPYYLGQELARWADVVVGDYNHFFDLHAMLFALTQAQGWRVALLVDEAHNLVERGRKMFSAELDQASLRAARRAAPAPVKRKLDALQRSWSALSEAMTAPHHPLPSLPAEWLSALQGAVAALAEYFSEADSGLRRADELSGAAASGHTPGGASTPTSTPTSTSTGALTSPAALASAVTSAISHPTTPPTTSAQADPVPPALRDFYLEALHTSRIAELFDEHALCDLCAADADFGPATLAARRLSTLHLRNVVPAPHLAPRWAAAHSATLFSATLQPLDHTRSLLGLPETTATLRVDSPFRPEQLQVQVAQRVSTRYAHRSRSLAALVQIMAQQFAAQPGNYLAFFSSHDYLQQVAQAFSQAHPEVPVWLQQRRMSEAAQQAFLDGFTEYSQGIGFAVLGGSFGEGVDLPGRRLIGAFIATMGLPQLNPVNERMRERLDAIGRYGAGYEAIYLYPGLQKVVQAAGRVIRTTSDHGALHLMDDRYARPEVQALLPAWWCVG